MYARPAECIYVREDFPRQYFVSAPENLKDESKLNPGYVQVRTPKPNELTFVTLMDRISDVQRRLLEKNEQFTKVMHFLNRISLAFTDAHEKETKEIREILYRANEFVQTVGVHEITQSQKHNEIFAQLSKVLDERTNQKALHSALNDLHSLYQKSFEDPESFSISLKAALNRQNPVINPGYPMFCHMPPPAVLPPQIFPPQIYPVQKVVSVAPEKVMV